MSKKKSLITYVPNCFCQTWRSSFLLDTSRLTSCRHSIQWTPTTAGLYQVRRSPRSFDDPVWRRGSSDVITLFRFRVGVATVVTMRGGGAGIVVASGGSGHGVVGRGVVGVGLGGHACHVVQFSLPFVVVGISSHGKSSLLLLNSVRRRVKLDFLIFLLTFVSFLCVKIIIIVTDNWRKAVQRIMGHDWLNTKARLFYLLKRFVA